MTTQTISEKILSAHCVIRCAPERSLFDPSRVFFSLDHYAPPDTPQTMAFHQRIKKFAASHGATVFEVGDGISHQVAVDCGLVGAGDLVVGACACPGRRIESF